MQHVFERFLEFIVVFLGEVAQRVNEHEFGHDFGEGVLAHHLGIGIMHASVVVGEVFGIGRLIHLLLVAVHVLEVLQIVGILHRHAVLGLGEVDEDAVAVGLCIGLLPVAHEHHVHIIIHVKAVSVVGITVQQLRELIGGSVIVLHLVLEDGAHVVQALLNDFVGRLDLFFGLGNLLEVVFLVVGILGTLQGLDIHLDRVAVFINHHAVGKSYQCTVGLLIVK